METRNTNHCILAGSPQLPPWASEEGGHREGAETQAAAAAEAAAAGEAAAEAAAAAPWAVAVC